MREWAWPREVAEFVLGIGVVLVVVLVSVTAVVMVLGWWLT